METTAIGTPRGSIQNISGMSLSLEQIKAYLDRLDAKDYSTATSSAYRRLLNQFYRFLPEDKYIQTGTLQAWIGTLLEAGYSTSTVNVEIAAVNGLMNYCGHREFQADRLPEEDTVQPELTRNEYLRLLSAARHQGNEKKYLLVKALCVIGLSVSELSVLTVEVVKAGTFPSTTSTLRIPDGFREELLQYIAEEGILTGPIFVTRTGKPMDRVNVTKQIQTLCQDAQVSEEKATPRCLKKLYLATKSGIQDNFALLVEQAYDRMLEKERQMICGEE